MQSEKFPRTKHSSNGSSLDSGQFDRRMFLQGATALLAAAPLRSIAEAIKKSGDGIENPSMIRLFTGERDLQTQTLRRSGNRWTGDGAEVTFTTTHGRSDVTLHVPSVPVQRLHLRWEIRWPENATVLGDAWERSYGDLAWLPIQPERVLPWYCAVAGRSRTRAFGVMTGAASLAFWQIDMEGLSLWLDLRNGGNGTFLSDRGLRAASIVTCDAAREMSPFETVKILCQRMAADAQVATKRGTNPMQTVLGSNDWYYAYGKNEAAHIVRDAEWMQELAPKGHRPFTVIDDGYQDRRRFPDMGKLAKQITEIGPVPGLWIRPLRAPKNTSAKLLLPPQRWGLRENRIPTLAYDPTIPEANAAAMAVVKEAVGWGYQLLKHDFTTFEMLGQWGSEMGAMPTLGNWHFNDRTRTNAEIIAAFYRDIRAHAGDETVLQGCNTIGHLSVGIFDTSRTGDDVSGREWERTRRMGVNTLPFRLPQHRTFFCVDPDCLPITAEIPWSLTKQWLHAIAASGTALIVSAAAGSMGNEQKTAVRDAFALCASSEAKSIPLDWMETRTPIHWSGEPQPYQWDEPQGASPFPVSTIASSIAVAG